MDFVDIVNSYAEKFKISWNQAAVTIAHLALQYPGGVTSNIVDSSFQILKKQLESASSNDSFVKHINGSNWGNVNYRDSNNKNTIYEGVLKESSSLHPDVIQFLSGKDSVECLYYITEAWKVNIAFLLNFLTLERKIRFSDTSVIVSKVLSNSFTKTVVKFLPSPSALLILEPFANQSDADFLTSAECSRLFKDITQAENLFLLVQIIDIYPRIGDRLEISIRDASNEKSTLVLWTSQTLLSSILKKDDFLLICNPYVDLAEENTCLQIGSKTSLFLVHPYPEERNESIEASTNAMKAITWSSSTFEKKFPAFSLKSSQSLAKKIVEERITTRTIPSFERDNITIYGRLAKVINAETAKGEKRLGIRLQDEFGYADITIIGNAVYSVGSCEEGHFVLFTNLSAARQCNGSYLLVASESTKMFNICKMIGLPSSSALHHITSIGEAIKFQLDFFYCRAFIIDCVLLSEISFHSKCKSKVDIEDGIAFCSSCLTFVDDVKSMNLYALTLDDGTGQINVEANEGIILDLNTLSKSKYISQHHFGIVNFGNLLKVSLYCANPPIGAIARIMNKI